MEKRIRTLNYIFAFLMAMTVLWTYAQPAYAASADIRVVSQIAFKDVDGIDCVKYKYNKKGLAKRKENYHNDVLNSAVNYIYDSYMRGTEDRRQKNLKATYRYNSNNAISARGSGIFI